MIGILFLVIRFLATAALFGFLGWALWLIWRDLKRQSEGMALSSVPVLKLNSLDEPAQENFQAAALEVVVGRDPACDLLLSDPTVSGQHARLSYRMAQWWVEDLQSTNGTFLNQNAIAQPVVLTDGDLLRFGQLSYLVEISLD
jgi:hypothetical protein